MSNAGKKSIYDEKERKEKSEFSLWLWAIEIEANILFNWLKM